MRRGWFLACAATLALSACGDRDAPPATSENAAAVAGDKTIADGLGDSARFAAAIKAAGLEPALRGPTPYTVLAPSDAAFEKLSQGAVDDLMKPEARKQLTAVLSNHILPGTMLAADIGKAIDSGGGKTQIATLGGGTLSATRGGDSIVLTDAAGTRAMVIGADGQRSNGVVHRIDAVLMPAI